MVGRIACVGAVMVSGWPNLSLARLGKTPERTGEDKCGGYWKHFEYLLHAGLLC